jgi:hypothetical protein
LLSGIEVGEHQPPKIVRVERRKADMGVRDVEREQFFVALLELRWVVIREVRFDRAERCGVSVRYRLGEQGSLVVRRPFENQLHRYVHASVLLLANTAQHRRARSALCPPPLSPRVEKETGV